MRKVLFLDCDGVLLDWTGPFLNFVNAPITPDQVIEYDMTKTGLWLDTAEFMNDLQRFEETNAWANLPTLCLMTSLEALKNIGYELRVLTMAGHTPRSRAARVQNLTKKFGAVFSGIEFVGPKDCKIEWIDKWMREQREQSCYPVEVHGLVEDKSSTLIKTVEYGLSGFTAYGIRRPYNSDTWHRKGIDWFTSVDALAFKLMTEV